MTITITTKQGKRITLQNAEPKVFWCQRLHQLYQGQAIAGYLIRP